MKNQSKKAIKEAERAIQNRALYENRHLKKGKPAINEHRVMVSALEM